MLSQVEMFRHHLRTAYHYVFPSVAFRRYIANSHGDEIEMDYLATLVDPGRQAIDVGANLGRYSVRLATLAKTVWAFEPHPRLAYILRRCLPRNVTVTQAAVSNVHSTVELHVPLKRNQQVESLATVEALGVGEGYQAIRVPCICLDDFADRDVGFVKIDVEGHEANVVRGAMRLLSAQRPVVLIEVDDHHKAGVVAEVTQLMISAGYDGIFWFRDRFRHVSEFDAASMQDERELKPGVPRKKCLYVNNFIFAPADKLGGLREQLGKQAGAPVSLH